MPTKLENKNLIRKFLFNELSEEERLDFEEKFILDEGLFEEIKVIEDELIEQYVRGWMNSTERFKFEQNFLTTKKRRERVEFSRQMIRKIEEQKEVPVVVRTNENETSGESVWNKFLGLFFTPRFAMAGGLALIIAVLGSWVLFQNFGSGTNEIVKKENDTPIETPIPNNTSTPVNSPDELPENVANNVRNEAANNNEQQNTSTNISTNNSNKKTRNSINKRPSKTPVKVKKPPVPKKTPVIRQVPPNPVLTLIAGTVRSGGKNNVIKLPKNAKGATLRLKLEAVDYKSFQAQLADQDGNIVFQRSKLKPRKRNVIFYIPAKYLKKGDYIVRLFGKNDSNENESVADFQFRIN